MSYPLFSRYHTLNTVHLFLPFASSGLPSRLQKERTLASLWLYTISSDSYQRTVATKGAYSGKPLATKTRLVSRKQTNSQL